MPVTAKICGLSTPEGVRAALDGGAGYLGFVFFGASPRNVTPEDAARLAMPARTRGVKIVAVTVDPDDMLLDHLRRTLRPDLLQMHGRETPARAREAAERAGSGAIKAIAVSSEADLKGAKAYEAVTEHLMFDAKPPKGEMPGGVGAKFDWTLLKGRRFARPWFLAGGLDPWNVAEAVAASRAPMVDVSSGVERGPGLKDPRLISAFLDAVRRA